MDACFLSISIVRRGNEIICKPCGGAGEGLRDQGLRD